MLLKKHTDLRKRSQTINSFLKFYFQVRKYLLIKYRRSTNQSSLRLEIYRAILTGNKSNIEVIAVKTVRMSCVQISYG